MSNVMLKAGVGKLPTKQLLALRALAGLATACLAYLMLGRHGEILSIQPGAWLGIFGVVISGYFGADLVFVYALEDLPVSRLFPIQAAYPLAAAGLAWYFFGDPLSIWMILGAMFVIVGVSLIGSEDPSTAVPPPEDVGTIRNSDEAVEPRELAPSWRRFRAYALTVLSAAGWGISAVLLRGVLVEYDPVTVNTGVAIITAACFMLASGFFRMIDSVQKHPTAGVWVGMAGFLGGTGISNLWFIISIQIAGVAVATILASVAPLFTSLFAVLFLKEKLTLKLSLGTALTVVGVSIFAVG
jgi:drug/metabolite transporter (DMT)-like permease